MKWFIGALIAIIAGLILMVYYEELISESQKETIVSLRQELDQARDEAAQASNDRLQCLNRPKEAL